MSARVPHVAVVNPVGQIGGAERSLLELIQALAGDPRITVVLPEDGPLRGAVEGTGAACCVLEWPEALRVFGERSGVDRVRAVRAGVTLPLLSWRLSRLLRRLGADVVVTNGLKAHIVGAAAARLARVPLVWYLREGLEDRAFSRRILAVASRACAGAVAISHYVEHQWRPVMPRRARIEVLYNIVDRVRFHPRGTRPPDLVKADGEIWFGVIGPLTPLKGQDLFVDACALVASALPEARFLMVGDNFYRTERALRFKDELQERARQRGVDDRVVFLGQRDDVPAVLRVLDVVVQPNRGPEGLGRSVLEAMAAGVPVIAVDRWGPAELIVDGETGLLAPWMDVSALAERMVRLARDGALRERLAANARAWVTAHIDPAQIAGAFRTFVHGLT